MLQRNETQAVIAQLGLGLIRQKHVCDLAGSFIFFDVVKMFRLLDKHSVVA